MKSANRSHILRPLRAAFAEYTGPIPFFVVPRLGEVKRGGREKKTEVKHYHMISVYNVTTQQTFFTCDSSKYTSGQYG